MELTKDEQDALDGNQGTALQTAYRVLVATGEAAGATKLVPVQWAHLSGVNYNTIGDAGVQFLQDISRTARFKIPTTINPMGYDIDSVSEYNLDDNFIQNQEKIRESYTTMGATPTFSCIPYDISQMPEPGTQVAFAESNAAIYANSMAGLKTNKESAFSALASAITGKSPHTSLRQGSSPDITVHMEVEDPDELAHGMLGYFAGKQGEESVNITGIKDMDHRSCKSLCGGMGTSGTCAKFTVNGSEKSEKISFDKKARDDIHDELNTSESGDIITLGSPQLSLGEIADLSAMLKNRSFTKNCMIFCPRSVMEQATKLGHTDNIRRAGAKILADCCTCLTPLVSPDNIDAVTTNSIKGAYYLKNSTKVGVNLKPLSEIIRDETR